MKIHGKRPLKIFLSCLLCLGLLLTAVPALAADNCRVTVSSAQGETGEEVNITVSIENPSGMAGGSLNLFYDPQVVSPVQATRTATKGIVSNLGYQKAGKCSAGSGPPYRNKHRGELFSVSFKIIGPGSSALTISDLTITNASLQQIAASVTHGSIINTAAPPPGEQDNTGSSGNSKAALERAIAAIVQNSRTFSRKHHRQYSPYHRLWGHGVRLAFIKRYPGPLGKLLYQPPGRNEGHKWLCRWYL